MSEPAEPGAGARLWASATMPLIAAGRLAQRRYEGVLAERSLSLRLVGAIGHLAHNSELSYSDLARRAHVTPQSMHATIAQLVELGAVVTETRGRAAYPRLTAHGRELLAFAADAAAQCDDAMVSDPGARSALREELMKIALPASSLSTIEGRSASP